MNFTHLHTHSVFSVRDGLSSVADIVAKAKEHGFSSVAITDHGAVTGSFQFINEAHKAGLKPIVGAELYVESSPRHLIQNRDDLTVDKKIKKSLLRMFRSNTHLVALALNYNGYKNLLKITNDAITNGYYYRPLAQKQVIFENSGDLHASSACYGGEISRLITAGNTAQAEYVISEYKEAFEDRFAIELMIINFPNQKTLNEKLIRLAQKTNTKTIITCDSHYTNQSEYDLHRILLNIDNVRRGVKMDDIKGGWEFGANDLYYKSMSQIISDWKTGHKSDIFTADVLKQSLVNSANIADMAEEYSLQHVPRTPQYDNGYEDLKRRCVINMTNMIKDGIIDKNRVNEYRNRLVYELKTIKQLNAVTYMLLFADVTNFCDNPFDPNLWENGIIPESISKVLPSSGTIPRGTGRGSAGGSLVAYLLGITQGVDPLKLDLLFERFLDINRIPRMKF